MTIQSGYWSGNFLCLLYWTGPAAPYMHFFSIKMTAFAVSEKFVSYEDICERKLMYTRRKSIFS